VSPRLVIYLGFEGDLSFNPLARIAARRAG